MEGEERERRRGGREEEKKGGKFGGWWLKCWLTWVGWLDFARFCCGLEGWSFVSSFKLVSPVGSTMAGRNAAVHPLDIGATVTGLSSKIRLSGWGWWRIEGGGSG